jgi:hypothetical protein
MRYAYSIALNDACWFLNQAKGLPDVPKTQQLISRYLRATVVFSWVALEQMLTAAIDEYIAKGKMVRSSIPKRLRDKLEHVLAAQGKTLDRVNFKKHRDLRNDITHDDRVFSISDVEEAHLFCIETIEAFFPATIWVTHEDLTQLGIRPTTRWTGAAGA